ncbi:flavodoxin domain-containing protein [Streptomyces sp. NPDC096152]|uniref:flavodoxin domain-containing protein n=1 Tax=Streptomyces sp. NPDC096152 TaxID=3366078 RepID=UPI003819D7BD
MDVLVGYASAHGSTREIAERAADVLRRAGLMTEARPLAEVDDADAYRAFVLGSAVHNQSWLAPARDFVRDHHDLLGSRPLWIFSVGMPAALRGPMRRWVAKEVPAIEAGLPAVPAFRSHRLFSGVVTPDQLPRSGRVLFRLFGGQYGDHRDWDAVERWAAGIADELAHERRPGS